LSVQETELVLKNWSVKEPLTRTGFGEIRSFPSLVGAETKGGSQAANLVIVGERRYKQSGAVFS